MELFSPEWFVALLQIIIIDLVLAGDNAIVIGMAARNVPKHRQKFVIIVGTFGAVAIRALATIAVVWLLKIPGLRGIGGLILVYIAYKLLVEEKKREIAAKNSVLAAIGTIMFADIAMGLDNVLAIGGAAHGDYLLVVIGLLVSIPIVVWGSTLVMKLMDRFPALLYVGSGVLAYTAAKMIVEEPFVKPWFANPVVHYSFMGLIVLGVLLVGHLVKAAKARQQRDDGDNHPSAATAASDKP
ncbi:MAG: hypothetical protein BLM47_05535 [Candidatus Reconcilbacillus cellulovorans]|uniref:Tellurium resistance protein TerC n=1 Tax=Candidatus Reconcilbacillus cellulovorans TaxID=1906605 RepID=A0A2A6E1C5_9BACL|nr:MAG: hypothetical protein BLM47_05535 [Candidatus Reconcilbacillus cellulovorans]